MINFTQLKTLFPLTIKEDVAYAHIKRAAADVKDVDFGLDEDARVEIIGSKTMYYLAPLLWVDMQNRVSEYEESLQTFKDIERFQKYWLERANTALAGFKESKKGNLSWAAV